MTLKTITVHFVTEYGGSLKTFSGWVYYMVSGDDYKFYEILSDQKNHRLLDTIERGRVKEIVETVL